MPRVEMTVGSGDGPGIAAAVARGDLDLGLVDGLAAPGDSLAPLAPLSALSVAEAMIAVVLPAGHPLANQPGVGLPSLADARWIDAPGVAPPLADVRRVANGYASFLLGRVYPHGVWFYFPILFFIKSSSGVSPRKPLTWAQPVIPGLT